MFRSLPQRAQHYLLLLLATAVLYLPNLGAPSLWDIDEGNNAEAAREMLERQDMVVPQFNYQLRVDKPALLYWLQIGAYRSFGVNEFAGRLPSALASMITVLLVYEFGRGVLGAGAGLIAGLVLASAGLFAAAAHFANPDALLNMFTTLTLFLFWRGVATGWRNWFIAAGVSSALAVLAKGPVGLVLPSAVAIAFLTWSRRLKVLLDRRLGWGVLSFALVAVPWYASVAAQTQMEWLKGFFLVHNLGRFQAPMEGHHGPVFYYLVVILLGLIPWSVFLGPAVWSSLRLLPRRTAGGEIASHQDFHRFLWCWIAVYLVFFSCSGTKLPNYVLPAYAPLALLLGDVLDRWRRGEVALSRRVLAICLGLLCLTGVGVTAGLLLASGLAPMTFMHQHYLPGIQWCGILGAIPVVAALLAWRYSRADRRTPAVVSLVAGAVMFIASLGATAPTIVDRYKAPRPLARILQQQHTEPDVRVACFNYFEPSLVFYCQREVTQLQNATEVLQFLRLPLPSYLFVPATVWQGIQSEAPAQCRLLDRHYDFYRTCEVLVITNR